MRLAWSFFHWPHLPTSDEVAYHLGIGSLTTWGIMQHISPVLMWMCLIGAAACVALWFVTSRFPAWLSFLPGAATVVSLGKAARVLSFVLAALAVFNFACWFVTLLWAAEQYRSLNTKVLNLENDLGCLGRPEENEHDLFACVPALRADAEASAKGELERQIATDADEKNRLAAERDALQAQLTKDDAEIDADAGASDPLPAPISRYFDRLRARRGLK